jgi:hypothetical protein
MQKLFLTTLLSVFTLLACEIPYQDPKNIEDRDFSVSDFNGIDISSSIEVEVIPAGKFQVTASGDYRDLDYLSITIRNKKLFAKCTRNKWFSNRKIKLFIAMPEIKSVNLSGASSGNISDFTNAKNVSIDLSGASELDIEFLADEVNGELSGASELKIGKDIGKIDLELSGTSNLYAFESNSISTYLDLSGASEANVSVKDFLKVKASGASKVRYKGSPNVDQDVSGSSKVVKY